ncbi:MAG: hypothetical protein IAF94_24290 [Pirellulaceae bacterium]|nr:hypothetical protein [Pirellulaceae bacterium]
MHGIDGRWHDQPQFVEQMPPVPPPPEPSFTAADAQELRFSLKEMFLATTIAAVMLALFRSTGIFGAVLSFLSAAIITLVVIPRIFPKDLPRQRLVFDFVWGMVMPVVCLVFDPFIFKNGGDPFQVFEPPSLTAPLAVKVHVNELAYLAWPFLAGQIATLGMVLAWGRSLRPLAPLLSGVLATGAVVACCLAGLLVLPAALGTFAWGIGLLGFTPFFTSFTFFRRMLLMRLLAGDWRSEKIKYLLAGLGVVLCLLLPILVGVGALCLSPPGKDIPDWLG